MLQHRQLLALLLVAAYAAVSAFGMSFVICIEGDGRRAIEALGAPCCASTDSSTPGQAGDEDTVSAAPDTGGDCGDCQAHLPAADLDATRVEEARADTSSPVLLPPTALPSVPGRRTALRDDANWHPPAGPPRPSPSLACLRTIVFRS